MQSALDLLLGINKSQLEIEMNQIVSTKTSCWQKTANVLALFIFLFATFQPLLISTAIWVAGEHGHDHQLVIHADENHLDVKLSHNNDQPFSDHDHEESFGLIADLFSTHDHAGRDHVLHFIFGETPDQIRQRSINSPAPTLGTPIVVRPIDFAVTATASAKLALTLPSDSPPPLTTGLLCLRTIVLLI